MKIAKKYLQKVIKEEAAAILFERKASAEEIEQTDLGAPVADDDVAIEALEQIAAFRSASQRVLASIRQEYAARALAKMGHRPEEIKNIAAKIPFWHEENAGTGGAVREANASSNYVKELIREAIAAALLKEGGYSQAEVMKDRIDRHVRVFKNMIDGIPPKKWNEISVEASHEGDKSILKVSWPAA
jgi:hypothetical protein